MAGSYWWHGREYRLALEKAMVRRLGAAAVHLSARTRADISQPGTLRYAVGTTKKGKVRQKTVYDFTHSRPGNPPYKQTGHLRRSVAWEVIGHRLLARVGVGLQYGRYLELGTTLMKARPFLRRNLILAQATTRRILLGRVTPGELRVASNQFRSGVAGKNFGAYSRVA